jgi:hypothetical protein
MLTRLPHLSQFSSAFSVVISGARVFPKHGICQGLRLLVRGQSPLFTVSVYSSEFVSVSIFLLCVCHLTRSELILCARCSFWAFLYRNSVVPMIFCAVTCKADTMIALAFSAY